MKARPSIIPILWLLIVTICISPLRAQDPQIRVSVSNPGDVWTGQRMHLSVELLVPGYFASAAAFDLPDPPGMMLVPPSGSPTIGSEEIGGVTYTTQRHTLSVFTHRAGKQSIPPFKVRIAYKRQPLDKEALISTLESLPVEFTTKSPPGAEHLGSVISARGLEVTETWNPEPAKAKAGDAFTRTIVFTAPDVPAMAFPPFPSAPIDGIGIYPKPPVVADHSERGDLKGERQDIISYICKRPGTFVIPASKLTWFDMDAKQLRTIDFPARTIEVAPNPSLASSPTSVPTKTHHWKSSAIYAAAILTTIAIICSLRKPRIRGFLSSCLRPLMPLHLKPLNPTACERPVSDRR